MAKVETQDDSIVTTKEVAVVAPGVTGVVIGGQQFEIEKQVNVPTLKQETGETVAFRIDQRIRQEVSYKEVDAIMADGSRGKVQQENIINVVRVTEASTMQPFEYVCNAITADNFRGMYEDHGYVGRWFAVKKLGTVQGKRYKDVQIVELKPTGNMVPA